MSHFGIFKKYFKILGLGLQPSWLMLGHTPAQAGHSTLLVGRGIPQPPPGAAHAGVQPLPQEKAFFLTFKWNFLHCNQENYRHPCLRFRRSSSLSTRVGHHPPWQCTSKEVFICAPTPPQRFYTKDLVALVSLIRYHLPV